MTENKRTVEWYMDGFRASGHEQILSCLADGVEWDMLAQCSARGGMAAFSRQCFATHSP